MYKLSVEAGPHGQLVIRAPELPELKIYPRAQNSQLDALSKEQLAEALHLLDCSRPAWLEDEFMPSVGSLRDYCRSRGIDPINII